MKSFLKKLIAPVVFISGIIAFLFFKKNPSNDSQEIINNAQSSDNELNEQANNINNQANELVNDVEDIENEIYNLQNVKDPDWHKK